jgi:hypothetical protein
MTQPLLALWRRVIFVDWHGVLSRDPFWTSILTDEAHPLHPSVQEKLGQVFARDVPTAHEWMKGLRTSDEIIHGMGIILPRRYSPDFLRRRLDEDCRKMRVNVELFSLLQACRDRALVVIATDNMDCFVDAFQGIRKNWPWRNKQADTTETFANWAMACDDIICSSDVGALKSEDPNDFFGAFLDACDLDFSNALLIDDRDDNCQAFTAQGGTAIRWKMQTDHVDEISRALDPWLNTATLPA